MPISQAHSLPITSNKDRGTVLSQLALGPIQNRAQYDRLRSTLAEIEKSGTGILYRGEIPQGTNGFFFPVILLDNPPDDNPSFVRKCLGQFARD